MEVPVGAVAQLWSFLSFLPFFFLLFTLGLLKAAIIGPIAVVILLVGNSAVIIGLWPAHFLWTYYCVAKSKKLGLVLKILVLVLLPLPLVLWAVFGILASLLGGIGYGFFLPLIATFEATGENFRLKFYHCFADGILSTIKGSCTAVQDLIDFSFHSYFAYMDELIEQIPADEQPVDIKLSKLPSCLFVCPIAVLVVVPSITAVALWKSPYMLFRGWKRLLEDLIGREGPFLETVCVPFAGLAIILWPLAVVGAVLGAFFSSFFLALYGGIIVYQVCRNLPFLVVLKRLSLSFEWNCSMKFFKEREINSQEDSLRFGLAYVISVVSLFDEYVNDLLYLREGSCLPRPKYRRHMNLGSVRTRLGDNRETDSKHGRESLHMGKLVSERSRTLKWQIQQHKPMQVWDWLFKSCEVNGRILIRDGLVNLKDIEECILTGDCKKLGIKLPAWSILQCLLRSAKSDASGLLISDDVELTRTNGPRDRVFDWYIGPLLIMKEQIKALQLEEKEESCLRELLMGCKNDKPEEWDDTCFPSSDNVRRAQLQAIIRRLKGLVGSISRIPTFRRRFKNLVKVLYLEALQASATGNHMGGVIEPRNGNTSSVQSEDIEDGDTIEKKEVEHSRDEIGNMV